MDKIKLIVDKTCGLKNEHYECEYSTSELTALRNYVSWILKLNLFDSITIYREDILHGTNK